MALLSRKQRKNPRPMWSRWGRRMGWMFLDDSGCWEEAVPSGGGRSVRSVAWASG